MESPPIESLQEVLKITQQPNRNLDKTLEVSFGKDWRTLSYTKSYDLWYYLQQRTSNTCLAFIARFEKFNQSIVVQRVNRCNDVEEVLNGYHAHFLSTKSPFLLVYAF